MVETRSIVGRRPLETMLADMETDASHAMARSYGDYTTNLPLKDLRNKQAWIAFRFDGKDLAPEHGGPARLLVLHLYLWKSVSKENARGGTFPYAIRLELPPTSSNSE